MYILVTYSIFHVNPHLGSFPKLYNTWGVISNVLAEKNLVPQNNIAESSGSNSDNFLSNMFS